jgi:hypothetical protein
LLKKEGLFLNAASSMTAPEAPFSNATGRKSWPSCFAPRIAMKRFPRWIVRVSMEAP